MFAFLCKQRRFWRTGSPLNIGISATTDLGFLKISPIVSFSSSPKVDKPLNQESFTVSYLVNTCGLSPDIAIPKSKSLHFESSERPDSVVTLLQNHGFSKTHISKLISRYPLLLLADPKKTLLPKLEFYRSIGASSDDIASHPSLFNYSLDNRILPCYHFLKSILISDKKVLSVLSHLSWGYLYDVRKNLVPNVALLKQVGVPLPLISLVLCGFPAAMNSDSDKFSKTVKEVLKLEFDPSKANFVLAICTICAMKRSTWEHKKEVFKRWGWSNHDISLAFKRHPFCMTLSEKKIMSGMDFLVNKMGFHSTAIARKPIVLCYSLEKRIIPRCSVMRALQLKGLIKKDLWLIKFLQPTEECFMNRFVNKFHKQVPQLMSVYQGECLS